MAGYDRDIFNNVSSRTPKIAQPEFTKFSDLLLRQEFDSKSFCASHCACSGSISCKRQNPQFFAVIIASLSRHSMIAHVKQIAPMIKQATTAVRTGGHLNNSLLEKAYEIAQRKCVQKIAQNGVTYWYKQIDKTALL